jgi:hypothetical protein
MAEWSLNEEKLMYERFWALLNDHELMEVFRRYGPSAFRRSSVLEGLEPFIVEQEFGGSACVEIGTLKGLTAIILSRYFDRVITIDIVDDPLKHEIAASLGIRNIEFHTVADNAEKARLIEALEFDGAYVDGDHARDTESDFALVRRCGQVLFHEHWPAQPAVVALCGRLGGVVTRGKFALWTRRAA